MMSCESIIAMCTFTIPNSRKAKTLIGFLSNRYRCLCQLAIFGMDRLAADVKDIGQLLQTQMQVVGAKGVEAAASAQCVQIVARVGALSGLTAPSALALTAAIQDGPWSPSQKTDMIDAVNNKLLGATAGVSHEATKRSTQTMTTFPEYLRQSDVDVLFDNSVHIMTKITRAAQVCWKVGLYTPTEATVRHVVAVALACTQENFSGSDTYGFVQEFKTYIRSKASAKYLPTLNYHIDSYPGSPKELAPELFQFAYADDPPVGLKLDCDLTKVAASVAIRRNSKLVNPPSAASSTSSGSHMASFNGSPANFLQSLMMYASSMASNPAATPLRMLAPAPRTRQVLAIADASPEIQQPTPVMDATTPSKEDSPPAAKTAADLFEMPDASSAQSSKFTPAVQAQVISAALAARTEGRRGTGPLKRPASSIMDGPEATEPTMPKKQGDPAAKYNGGKILRSDTQECWRVFLKVTDKPDKKVKFNGNPSKAFKVAMAMIDEHVAQPK
jgi:hypothetical protein